jgi:hypothetical protein
MTKTKTSYHCPDCEDTGFDVLFGDKCAHPHIKAVNMASEAQLGYLSNLLSERPVSYQNEMREAMAKTPLTAKLVSSLIETVLKVPVDPALVPVRKNTYAGTCGACKTHVAALEGRIAKVHSVWVTYHLTAADCETALVAAKEAADRPDRVTEPGMYSKDGEFYKVKWNMGKTRLYGLRLVHTAAGPDFVYDAKIIDTLSADDHMTAAEAHKFGAAFDTCVNCLKALTDEKSVVAKYGQTCAKNMGWRYPTKKEADAVLAGDLDWAEIVGEA